MEPVAGVRRTSRTYRGDTLILETRFETDDGAVRIIDFMPMMRGVQPDVVRIVTGERGEVRMRSDLRLRFDYGRLLPWRLRDGDGRARLIAGPHACRLCAPVALEGEGEGLSAEFVVREGDRLAFVLTYFPVSGDEPDAVDPEQALRETEDYWTRWSARCTYDGPWRDAVMRSLITMKALVHDPSGGIIAAPTSSLPEVSGGSANWDYRYCWLRDATFTLLAFLRAGYLEEASAWRDWLLRAVAGHPSQIQPAYGVAGDPRLTEWTADWLSGFDGAAPVRFGNAAFEQYQLDVFGEIMDAFYVARAHGAHPPADAWEMQRQIVAHVEDKWREPDAGIWESRQGREQFTYSKAMAWVAVDRAIRSCEKFGLEGPVAHWKTLRDEIHREVCDKGFDPDQRSFVRSFGSKDLDASLLLLPAIGFLPADDPRIAGTIEAIGARLGVDGFLRRRSGDGPETSFIICNFWWAHALIQQGRRDEATALFERVLGIRNDLGLLSEEYDTGTDRLLGNFPQALSHLGLVNTAYDLLKMDGRRVEGDEAR